MKHTENYQYSESDSGSTTDKFNNYHHKKFPPSPPKSSSREKNFKKYYKDNRNNTKKKYTINFNEDKKHENDHEYLSEKIRSLKIKGNTDNIEETKNRRQVNNTDDEERMSFDSYNGNHKSPKKKYNNRIGHGSNNNNKYEKTISPLDNGGNYRKNKNKKDSNFNARPTSSPSKSLDTDILDDNMNKGRIIEALSKKHNPLAARLGLIHTETDHEKNKADDTNNTPKPTKSSPVLSKAEILKKKIDEQKLILKKNKDRKMALDLLNSDDPIEWDENEIIL